MNIGDVEKIVASGRGPQLEIFSDLDSNHDAIAETVCAFANTEGGSIVIGAKEVSWAGNSVDLKGIYVNRGVYAAIKSVGQNLKPPVGTEHSDVETTGNVRVFVIHVPMSDEPVFYGDSQYVRKGHDNVVLETDSGADTLELKESGLEFNLDDLLRAGESQTVQFENDDDSPGIAQGISALANSGGGTLYVGIDPGTVRKASSIEGKRDALLGTSSKFAEELPVAMRSQLHPMPQFSIRQIGDADRGPIFAVEVEPWTEELVVVRAENSGYLREATRNSPSIHADPNKLPPLQDEDEDESEVDDAGDAQASATAARVFGGQLGISREATDKEECLSADEYSSVLAGFFAETDEDVSLGLFGHWGRGKTYLINKVAKKLKSESAYECATFSAWKYRTTPELWAHLYETVADAARKSHWFMWLFMPFRVALAKRGVWSFCIALFGFGALLLTASDKVHLLALAVQFLGLGGIAYLAFVGLRSRTFGAQISEQLRMASHRQALGLQAAIGDDLRALLIGWIPKDRWIPMGKHSPWLGILAYVAAVGFVFWNLDAPAGEHSFNLPVFGQLTVEVPSAIPPVLQYLWLVLGLMIPSLSFFFRQGPRRLLLVVDDLDRCEPDTMLEIIESVTLLLDDDEVRKRMQIAMLVEEDALESALCRKYKHLWNSVDEQQQTRKRRQIVNENKEKIFLSHLRLPLASEAELKVLFQKYMQHESEDFKPEESPPTETPVGPVAPSLKPSRNPDPILDPISGVDLPSEPKLPTVAEIRQEFRLGKSEQDAIWDCVASLTEGSDPHGHRWGPRAVRCFLHKYRLARVLARKVGKAEDISPETIIQELLKEEPKERVFPEQDIAYFCAQVK